MVYSEIKHKLRVFISSKCDGKYAIARKALKVLLEATGLIETYVFEAEPASSEDTKSSYLEFIDESNLCIFLVDNSDVVPAAVLSEEKRAKDKGLRLLYVFCNETQNEPTPMQKEIKEKASSKYVVVPKFSEIVEQAYFSVMQDLITIYRRKDDKFSEKHRETSIPEDEVSIPSFSKETYSMPKERYTYSAFITQTLRNGIFPISPSEMVEATSNLEKSLARQLNVILCRSAFNEASFKVLEKEILNKQDMSVKDLIKRRLDAQLYYFKADYEKSLELLQEALGLAVTQKSIPIWMVNDVAIDIRYVFERIDDQKNRISVNNPGQKHLNESNELVFYPLLDRQVEKMQEAIANQYLTELTVSPYTTHFGSLDEMFKDLSNAFCIAQMHGSIIQTIICRERLISIASMLCTLYDEHSFVFELIRLLVINQDSKKLDSLIRTYNQSVDIINNSDMQQIIESVNCITDVFQRYKSKYLLVGKLGYYMDDESYQNFYDDLVAHTDAWVHDEQRLFSLSTYIFDFFRDSAYRAKYEHTIDFIISIFNHDMSRFYHNCFNVLQSIDYTHMTLEYQRKVRDLLAGILSGKFKCDVTYECIPVCIRFCKSAKIPFKQLEKSIEKKSPSFYKNTFKMEVSLMRKENPIEYIMIYLEEANSRNTTQGKNGHYSGYSHEPFDTIYNILLYSDYNISDDVLADVLDSTLNTLAESRQTISAKISAVKLVQYLFFRTQHATIWEKAKQVIIANKEAYTSGYEVSILRNDTKSTLHYAYDLLFSCFNPTGISQVIQDIFCIDQHDALSIISYLDTTARYLESGMGILFDNKIIEAILYFCILMIQHRERDIKYYATKCLIGLTGFEVSREIALEQLSQLMNNSSREAKLAILVRMGQIKYADNSFVEQIFNKGKADNNYLVRLVAEREYNKCKQ